MSASKRFRVGVAEHSGFTSFTTPARAWRPVAVAAAAVSLCAVSSAVAGDFVWDGGAGTSSLNDLTNWNPDTGPVTSGDNAIWDATVPGSLSLTWANAGFGPGTNGYNLVLNAGHTGTLQLDSVSTSTAGMSIGTIAIANGAGALTLGNGTGEAWVTFRGTNTFTNNDNDTAVLRSDLRFATGGGTNRTLTFDGSGNWQVDAVLKPNQGSSASGAFLVTKNGGGTLTLNATNTGLASNNVAGTGLIGFTINQGTVQAGATGALGNTATVTFGQANTNSASLLNTGAFTQANAISVTAGNSGTLTIGGNHVTGTSTYTGNIALGSAVTFSAASGGQVDFTTGVISGAGAVTIAGGGTVRFAGTNTYTNTTTIGSTGTLAVAANAHLGANAAPVSLNGGTLRATTGFTNTHAFTIGAAGGTISVPSTTQLFFNTPNTLLGNGPLTLTGNGMLTANTGNLRVGQTNTYGGNLTVNSGGIFEYGVSGAVASGATFTAGNQGEIAVNNGVTLPNAITVSGGTNSVLSFENGTTGVFSGPITANANLTVGLRDWYNSATVRGGTISGAISGSGGLTVTSGSGSGGTLTLSGANTYTGATTLNVSNLVLDKSGSNAGALGNTAVNVGPNTLTVRGSTNIGTTAAATLTVGNGTAGTLSLQDTTINTLTLGGALTLNKAALNFDIGGNGTTGTADRFDTGGAASLSGTNTFNFNLLGGQVVTSGSYTLLTATSGLAAGTYAIGTKPAGFNSFSIDASSDTAAVLNVVANSAAPVQYWTGKASTTGTPADTAPYKWGYGSTLTTPVSNWSTDAAGTIDALQVPLANTDAYFTATNATATAGNTLATQLDGAYGVKGLFFDTSTNAAGINVVTVDTNGNTLAIGGSGLNSLAANTSAVTISGSGPVLLNGTQAWANNSANALAVNTAINGNAATGNTNTLTFNGSGAGAVTLGGIIGNGAGGGALALTVNKSGPGPLTLGAVNTYTGGTTISTGTVRTGVAGALPAGGALTVNGGTLDLNDTNQTVGVLAGSGGTILNNGAAARTLTVASGSYSGVLANNNNAGAGTLALAKTGAGTVILSGSNTYTGGTTVSGGVINVQSSTALGAGGQVNQATGNRGAGIQLQGGVTLPNSITFLTSNDGTGTVPYALLNVSGDNTVNGAFTLTDGGGGTIIQSDSGALTLNGNIGILATKTSRGIVLQGASTAANTFAGVLSDLSTTSVASITKNGPGSWTVSGTNTYTGPTVVTNGTLNVTGVINANNANNGTAAAAPAQVTVGNLAGGTAVLNVNGTVNAPYATAPSVQAGTAASASGTINVPTGGVMAVGSELWLSTVTSAEGTLNVTGGAVTVGSWLAVGRGGNNGNVNVSGGSVTANTNNVTVGSFGGNVGQVSVTGGLLSAIATASGQGNIYVGESGTGTLSVSGSGEVTAAGPGGLQVALNAGSSGTVNLGNGTTGGTITTRAVGSLVSTTSTSTSTFNFNGGTLKAGANASTAFMQGLTTANVRNGGATFDTNGQAITVAQPLQHSTVGGDNAIDGGLTKTGNGSLALTGANTYTGNTNINAGTLQAGAPRLPASGTLISSSTGTGTVNVNPGGTLAGTIAAGGTGGTGDVNVKSGGTVTAGSGATAADTVGTLATGAHTWNGGGTYAVKFANSAAAAGIGFDTLTMTTLNLASLSSGNKFALVLLKTTGGTFDAAAVRNYQLAVTTTGSGSLVLPGAYSLPTAETPRVNITDLFALDTSGIGVSVPESYTVTASFTEGGNYAVNFDYNAAPEPGTLALAGLAVAPLLGRRRRKSTAA